MTPAARDAAAIDLLNRWLAGEPAEAALTRWARGARYAGSSDREALRDLVFTAIRRARSSRAMGGDTGNAGGGGRAMVLGLMRERGDPAPDWAGVAHAPEPPGKDELHLFTTPAPDLPRAQALDVPDWLLPHLEDSLGPHTDAILLALRERAPVFVRAHAGRCTPAQAINALVRDGIQARPHPLSPWALELTSGARRLRNSAAFSQGLVEPQDAASQAVVATFAAALSPGAPVLDFCAGGGGKALALAALGHPVTAHDVDRGRMRDLPVRAARARTPIALIDRPQAGWAGILADVPCSGSGSWRRAPEGKWALTPARLDELTAIQARILAQTASLVAPGGLLGYATCSILEQENTAQIRLFTAASPQWTVLAQHQWTPLDGGDGFFLALLRRA